MAEANSAAAARGDEDWAEFLDLPTEIRNMIYFMILPLSTLSISLPLQPLVVYLAVIAAEGL